MLFPTYTKNIGVKNKLYKFRGGGGRFVFRKTLNSFSFHFRFYAVFNNNIFLCGNIEKCPFTYWLNGRWFLQIVDMDSGNLYPLFSYSDLLSQMWGVGVGVGGNIFFAFYAISNINF